MMESPGRMELREGTAQPAVGSPKTGLARPGTLTALRVGLTLATFAVLFFYLRSRPPFDFSSVRLSSMEFGLACACILPILWLRAFKWKWLLVGAAPAVTLGQAGGSYLGAMALGLVTPGRIGEFSRGIYLPHAGAQGWRGAGLVMLDNWIDFLAVLAWACIGWVMLMGWGGLALGAALFLVFAPIKAWVRALPYLTSRLPKRWGLRESATSCADAAATVSGWNLSRTFALGLLAYGLEWLQMGLLLGFLTPDRVDPIHLAGVMGLVTLANSLQITLAGLGVREGIAMFLLAREGVGSEAAVMAAFLQSALILFLPALAGLAVKPVALHSDGGGGGVEGFPR